MSSYVLINGILYLQTMLSKNKTYKNTMMVEGVFAW